MECGVLVVVVRARAWGGGGKEWLSVGQSVGGGVPIGVGLSERMVEEIVDAVNGCVDKKRRVNAVCTVYVWVLHIYTVVFVLYMVDSFLTKIGGLAAPLTVSSSWQQAAGYIINFIDTITLLFLLSSLITSQHKCHGVSLGLRIISLSCLAFW